MDAPHPIIAEEVVGAVEATVPQLCGDEEQMTVCAEPTVEADTVVSVSAPHTEVAADATQPALVEINVEVSDVTMTENADADAEDHQKMGAEGTADVTGEEECCAPSTLVIPNGEIRDAISSASAGEDSQVLAEAAEPCAAEVADEHDEHTEAPATRNSEDATAAGGETVLDGCADAPADTEMPPPRGSNGSEAGTPSPPPIDDVAEEKATAAKKRQRSVSFSNVVSADSPSLEELR